MREENELRRRQEEMKKKVEEENRRKAAEEAKRVADELERKKLAAEEANRKAAEEAAKKKAQEEEARRRAEAERQKQEEERKRAEEEMERQRIEKEMAEKLQEQLMLEEAEKARIEEENNRKKLAEEECTGKKQKEKLKVSGQRSKKPTMAREWRKLKEKKKQDATKELTVEHMEVDTTPEISPLPPRAKYVPPVFKENESYTDRHNTFLIGAWPHNNKKGIPTPSELAEAGFFFIGPGDYCRCYQCGLEQMCWEPFESPWVRHGFLAPDCCYVERIKGREWVESVLKGEF